MCRRVFVFFFLGILIFACRGSNPASSPRITDIPSRAATWTVSPPSQSTATPRPTTSVSGGLPSPTISATPEKTYQLCSPLAEHAIRELFAIVSDPYAPPPMGKDGRHQGVDFAYYQQGSRASIEGEGVVAILPGRVAAVLDDRLPYGNMVIIETRLDELWPELVQGLGLAPGESLYHLYAHFGQSPPVTLGQQVACGELIGEVGKTGYNIPVPHLHLETRLGPAGMLFESMAYYDTRASEIERHNYELWRMSGTFRHFDPMRIFGEYWLELGMPDL